MEKAPPSPRFTLRRRVLMALTWGLSIMLAHTLGWYGSLMWFPWGEFPKGQGFRYVGFFIQSASAGSLIAVAQYVMLRCYIPNCRWLYWLPTTAVSYGLGYGVATILWAEWSPGLEVWVHPAYLPVCGLAGLIVGTAQAQILERRLGVRWWYWVFVSGSGTTLGGWLWAVSDKDTNLVSALCVEGGGYGGLTGLGLALLVRRFSVPRGEARGK